MVSKVLIIIPSLAGGGTERALLSMLRDLNEKYRDRLIMDLFVLSKGGVLDNEVNTLNLLRKIKYITTNKISFKLLSFCLEFEFFSKILASFIIREKYNIGVAYQESKWSKLIAYSTNISRKVTWFHSVIDSNPGFNKLISNNSKLIKYVKKHKNFSIRVFVSHTSKNSFEKLTNLRVRNIVVYNRIDKEIIEHSENKINKVSCVKSGFKIVMIGNLLPVKNYVFALEVFKVLKLNSINFEVGILGSGPEESIIRKYINDSDLANEVKMYGYVENVYPYLIESDIYFTTSISEARPTALIEALIFNLPYIAPNIPAYIEMKELYGGGSLFKSNNVNDCSKVLATILTNLESRVFLTNEIRCIDWNKVGSNYTNIFDL